MGPANEAEADAWGFDLNQVTRGQYSDLRLGKLSDAEDDALLARAAGMSVDMIQALPVPVWRHLFRAFFRRATEPLADPNSPAPSSSA